MTFCSCSQVRNMRYETKTNKKTINNSNGNETMKPIGYQPTLYNRGFRQWMPYKLYIHIINLRVEIIYANWLLSIDMDHL